MTSLELVKKLVAKGANLNARMTRKVERRADQPEHHRRDALLAGRQHRAMPS